MQKIILLLSITTLALSCKNNTRVKGDVSLPTTLPSINIAKANLKNKTYIVSEAGTVNIFNPNQFEWVSQATDTTAFYNDYMKERKSFSLHFINDTVVKVKEGKKSISATYLLEKDTSAAVLLKISYADSSFSFNPGEAMIVTSTYKIRGIDNTRLLMETPNEINRKKIILLMKDQQ